MIPGPEGGSHLLAVLFETGLIYLLRSHDDVTPIVISTGIRGAMIEWNNSGELLAVAGYLPLDDDDDTNPTPPQIHNVIKFYTRAGTLRYTHLFPPLQVSNKA